jgi:hypothetical protein
MSLIILLAGLTITFAIGFGVVVDRNRRLKNMLTATMADLLAWQASCTTLQASINRYEELAKGSKVSTPVEKPIPISESSTDRWSNVHLE